MGISLVVAVTDNDWFEMLRARPDLAEINFWAPSAASFKALRPGELFLFKLHSPRNSIVGGGVFAYANVMPCSLAWAAFGQGNGAHSLQEMRTRIAKYRRAEAASDRKEFSIGCRILTQPFFFAERDWIGLPMSWSPNIVSFKTFNTDDDEGRALWVAVHERLGRLSVGPVADVARYGEPQLVRPRLGQGAFRVLVTDLYQRRCAVTGERTLPALEAAHIRPYSEGGVHEAPNGILLRRDIHSLFDAGYVTIGPDLRFSVSRRIREEYENGKHYYALDGQSVAVPSDTALQPNRATLSWHNENRSPMNAKPGLSSAAVRWS